MGQWEQWVLTRADVSVPVPVFVLRKFRYFAWEVTCFVSNILQKRIKSSLLESTTGTYPDIQWSTSDRWCQALRAEQTSKRPEQYREDKVICTGTYKDYLGRPTSGSRELMSGTVSKEVGSREEWQMAAEGGRQARS